ncbi:MAG: hypothetical protein QME51_06205 [Planctomycetota bacterium]|nr:hypothetical protein [Planctomycetota bacterium]
MKTVFEIELSIPATNSPADDMEDKWEKGMVASANIIHQRLKKAVKSEGVFGERIVEPSARWFAANFPTTYNRRGKTGQQVIESQEKNLAAAFHKWDKACDHTFGTVDGEEAKVFKDKVRKKKGNIRRLGLKTLPVTGDKVRGLGAGPIAGRWLIGEGAELIRASDKVIKGNPTNAMLPAMENPFMLAFCPKITQAYAAILNSGWKPERFTQQNTQINTIVNGFLNVATYAPFSVGGVAPATSFCDIVMEESGLISLHLRLTSP